MNVKAIDAGLDQWIAKRVTPPRTEGLHVSVVLTDMLKSLPGKKYATWGKKRDDDRDPMWEGGYAWEDVLAKALADRTVEEQGIPVESGELALDSIFGTPDRLFALPDAHGSYRLVDEEAKFTWMSCKELLHDPDKRPEKIEDWNPMGLLSDVRFTYWLLQGKTYAAMLYINRLVPVWTHVEDDGPPVAETMRLSARGNDDMIPTPLVRLRALFINGAYRDALAIPAAFELEYTPDELTSWWKVVKGHAALMAMRESTPDAKPAF